MSDHTRAQQQLQFNFSENPQEYAPWVATYGLLAPYGECQCGCGERTSIAKKTETRKGYVKGEPKMYLHGHNARVFAPPGFKFCSMCQETKPIDDFYLPKGRNTYGFCRECGRKTRRDWHLANRDKRIERIREYRLKNRDMLAAKERERRADPDYRQKVSVRLKSWRERNKEYVAAYNQSLQVKARNRVNKLVEYGKLPRPDELTCAHCQEVMAAHYHHQSGYEREHWLDVVPLCTECHGKAHWVDG